jgi:hypothetical protein
MGQKSALFSYPLLSIRKKTKSRAFGLDRADPAEFLARDGPKY